MTPISITATEPSSQKSLLPVDTVQPKQQSLLTQLFYMATPTALQELFVAIPPKDFTISILRGILPSLGLLGLSWYALPDRPLRSPLSTLISVTCLSMALDWSREMLFGLELPALRRQYSMHQLCKDQTKEDVVVYVKAYNDWNGATSRIGKARWEILERLAKRYSIVNIKAKSIHDVNAALNHLKSSKRKVKLLWFSAHGTPNQFTLSRNTNGSIGNHPSSEIKPKEIRYDLLDPEATLLVHSCYTGMNLGLDGLNIAEEIQLHSQPRQRVYAPTNVIMESNLTLEDEESLTFAFGGTCSGKEVWTAPISHLGTKCKKLLLLLPMPIRQSIQAAGRLAKRVTA